MRVTNKMIYENYSLNLMANEVKIQKYTRQVSTGKRIEKPSDDYIGTSRSMSYRSQLSDISRYLENSKQAISWYTATDDAFMTLTSDLQRIRELVVAGANDTLNTQAREAMADEIDEIQEAIMQVANSSISNRYIFAGTDYTAKAYEMRTVVAGDSLDIEKYKINIDRYNNQFQIKLDDDRVVTVGLSYPKTYDGSPGNTLDDLAKDIETQLHYIGFDVPVHAKLTPDNNIQFYAGPTPPDKPHDLVLKDGPAIKSVGTARMPITVGTLTLDTNANPNVDYYNNWTIEIVKGKGAGQIRRITAYDGTAITGLNNPWDPNGIPDTTSEYRILPPLEGTAPAGGANVTLPGLASDIDDFYNGMDITFYDDNGLVVGRENIIDYDGALHQLTLAGSPAGTYHYTITPHTEGNVANPVALGGTTIDLDAAGASQIPDFYNGASITVTHENGVTETRKIVGYSAGPAFQVTVDSGWDMPLTTGCTYKISDSTLQQLGIKNKSTTKELHSATLSSTIDIQGRYPVRGNAQPPFGANSFNIDSSTPASDYTNWTVTITKGPGAGKTYTVTGMGGGTTLNVIPAVDPALDPLGGSAYALSPPLIGNVVAPLGPNQIQLAANSSLTPDFYKDMIIEIIDGFGVAQKRTITDYDPATQIATIDKDWDELPNASSRYFIDPDYYQNANNKIQVKIGTSNPQEISLDGGRYTPAELAKMVETKIRERGGDFDNIRVYATPDNQLKIVPLDPDLNDFDEPLDIQLFSGSKADALHLLGFVNGTSSGTGVPNFEGNKSGIEYQVNLGVKIQINTIGDRIFDRVFKHLTEISIDLRSNNTVALSGKDLENIQNDIDQVLMAQGELGAKSNRLEKAVDRLDSLEENVTKLLSNVEDIDLSQVIIDLRMRETAYQAALQAGGRILPMSLLDYLR